MTSRPLVSLCVITYNQEKFVAEAVNAAINQSYHPLEIIFSDDASSDQTFEIMRSIAEGYSGDARIILNKNQVNMGLAGHVNKLIHSFSSGEFIALAAGDDISTPDRLTKSVEFLEQNQEVVAVSTSLTTIDHAGSVIETATNTCKETKIFTLQDYLADSKLHINGPSRTFRRIIPETFGPLEKNCPTEDSTYLLRCFLFGKVAMLADSLVRYRLHDTNMSSSCNIKKLSLSKIQEQYFRDITMAEKKFGLDIETKNKLLDRINLNMQEREHSLRQKKKRGTQFLSWLANKISRITLRLHS
jgi:glycosyltransferase involved in cell wall biosynthesis